MSLSEFFFGISDENKRKFPWMFTTEPVDRRNHKRQVPMRVLSLGMGRTGTASMQKALQILGYPTYHGFEIHANKPDNALWIEAFDAKYRRPSGTPPWTPQQWRVFFDALLGHVSAVTDLPCNSFGPELMDAYPEAKVVLVERDIESWYRSWEPALIQSLEIPGLDFIEWIDEGLKGMLDVAREGVMKCQFGAADTKEYRARARPTYRAHYAEVREHLKNQPDRLLEYKMGSGWEPLCNFLGKEIPEQPFPHINESAAHAEMGKVAKVMMARQAVGFVLMKILPVAAVLGAVYWQLFAR